MTRSTKLDLGAGAERLFTKIEAYLAVVDAMRGEGIEPCWLIELRSPSRRLVRARYKEAANDR